MVSPEAIPARVAAAVEGGVNLVQLRAKEMPGGQLLSLAKELRRAVGDRALLIVNERVDVAAAARADGVQLGEEALPVSAATALLAPGSLVGRSVHSAEGADRAVSDGADFLVVGTMFATESHPGEAPAGPALPPRHRGPVRPAPHRYRRYRPRQCRRGHDRRSFRRRRHPQRPGRR